MTGAACLLESALPKPPFSDFLARETTRRRRLEGSEVCADGDGDFDVISGDGGDGEEVEQPLLPLFLLAAAAAGDAQRRAAQADIVMLAS